MSVLEARGLRKIFGAAQAVRDVSFHDALASRELVVASVYTTDGRIDALHLRTLSDPAGALPPYDAVVLARRGFTEMHPRVAEALRALDGRIDARAMRRMNAAVDRDGRSPREVAASWAARPRWPAPGLRRRPPRRAW